MLLLNYTVPEHPEHPEQIWVHKADVLYLDTDGEWGSGDGEDLVARGRFEHDTMTYARAGMDDVLLIPGGQDVLALSVDGELVAVRQALTISCHNGWPSVSDHVDDRLVTFAAGDNWRDRDDRLYGSRLIIRAQSPLLVSGPRSRPSALASS